MNKIKLIIFDYDGVIADSFPAVHNVFRKVSKNLGKESPDEIEEFRRFSVFGNSTEFFNKLGLTKEERLKAYEVIEAELPKQDIKPYEGICGVLKSLSQKYKLAVVSSSFRDIMMRRLKEFGLEGVFAEVLGREHKSSGRLEKTVLFGELLRRHNIAPNEAILVGDRDLDFKEGVAAGLTNIILVEYGWGYSKDEVQGHNQRISVYQPSDILKAVAEIDK